MHSWLEVMIAG